MILTIGNVIFLIFLVIVCLVVSGCAVWIAAEMGGKPKNVWWIGFGVSCAICLITFLCLWWYNTNTASGKRALKDTQSELNNGIEREIIITAEDGREIFRYRGKVDIESNHTDNYIKFESEEGLRYIIYYGIQDTITIIECDSSGE